MQQDWMQSIQFPHSITKLEWRETHISQILLTGDWVYKIKKPVDFGFLDFSTLDKRRYFCEEELRLNRRSAPELYHSVEPLCRAGDHYNFCGEGEVVDYAVKMRQFDPDSLLQMRMPTLVDQPDFFQSLGYGLAKFHEQAAISPGDEAFGTADAVCFPVDENFRQILPRLSDQDDIVRVQRIQLWSEEQGKHLSDVFERRKFQGMIRECHGDLHLGNIALIDEQPVMFDCIEFNERFRWIDVASDLAFLVMDMEFNGYARQANGVLNSYLEYSADYDLLSVLNFYRIYRALVRAKVAVLRMEQAEAGEAAQLLDLFRRYLAFAEEAVEITGQYLAITCGVSGSGKSTLARKLAGASNAIHLRSDVVRKQLVGLKPLDSSEKLDPDNPQLLYSQPYTDNTFQQLEQLAGKILGLGYPVLVDATFLKSVARFPFMSLAKSVAVPYHIIYLNVPRSTLVERILKRQQESNDASEAGVQVMEQQLEDFQGFSAEEQRNVISAETDSDSDSLVVALLKD